MRALVAIVTAVALLVVAAVMFIRGDYQATAVFLIGAAVAALLAENDTP